MVDFATGFGIVLTIYFAGFGISAIAAMLRVGSSE